MVMLFFIKQSTDEKPTPPYSPFLPFFFFGYLILWNLILTSSLAQLLVTKTTSAMDRMAPAPTLFIQPSMQCQWSYRGEDKLTNNQTIMKPAVTEKVKL